MNNQEALINKFIGEYEEVEKLIKDQISNDDFVYWDDESLLLMKRLFKMIDSYKDILLQQAKQNDYLVNTITDINNKIDKLIDRA